MTEKRLLALVAFLIGLVGGLLILVEGANGIQRFSSFGSTVSQLVGVIVGVAILLGSLLIYRSKYGSGGLLDILLGVVALILQLNSTGGILAIVAGVVGLIASEGSPR